MIEITDKDLHNLQDNTPKKGAQREEQMKDCQFCVPSLRLRLTFLSVQLVPAILTCARICRACRPKLRAHNNPQRKACAVKVWFLENGKTNIQRARFTKRKT